MTVKSALTDFSHAIANVASDLGVPSSILGLALGGMCLSMPFLYNAFNDKSYRLPLGKGAIVLALVAGAADVSFNDGETLESISNSVTAQVRDLQYKFG